MPRVVPSDVVKAADAMFSNMVQNPRVFPQVEAPVVPNLAALAQLVEAVPEELLVLEPSNYAALVANVAYLRALGEAFQARSVIP